MKLYFCPDCRTLSEHLYPPASVEKACFTCQKSQKMAFSGGRDKNTAFASIEERPDLVDHARKRRREEKEIQHPADTKVSWVAPGLLVLVTFCGVIAGLLMQKNKFEENNNLHLVEKTERYQMLQSDGKARVYQESLKAGKVLHQFLKTPLPESRIAYVWDADRVFGKMLKDVNFQTNVSLKGAIVPREAQGVVAKDGIRQINYAVHSGDQKLLDVSLLDQGEGWKVDWEEYVRSCEIPFYQFVNNKPEGVYTFRAYVRVEEDLREEFLVRFIEPVAGRFEASSLWTPSILVSKQTPQGQKLYDHLQDWRDLEDFSYHLKSSRHDPEGLRRVRVKLSWDQNGESVSMISLEALHWAADGVDYD